MKNTLSAIASAVVISAASLSAAQIEITQFDATYGGDGGARVLLNSTTPSVSGTFDINPPYIPGVDTINSAVLSFYYADDSSSSRDGDEYVSITLDLTSWFSEEVGENDSVVNTLTGSFLTALRSDGVLNYTVTATTGDFYYEGAKLVVKYTEGARSQRVPDGGATLACLGMAFIGLAALKRKLS